MIMRKQLLVVLVVLLGFPVFVLNAVAPADFGLQEGDLISAALSDDPDVYIINEFGHKRLFLNPEIFAFYPHLGGFANVKSVTPEVRDVFPTSGLFRNCEDNDPKVYGTEITGEDIGTLRWVDTTAEQALVDDVDFFEKVFCINKQEFEWYPKGDSLSSVKDVPQYDRSSVVSAVSTPPPPPPPPPLPLPLPYSDTTPPVQSNGYPGGGALPAGTSSITLSFSTNEKADCRYSTTSGVSYSSMSNSFAALVGGTIHSIALTGFDNGTTYNYYLRCIDSAGNVNLEDGLISFSIAGAVPIVYDIIPPVRSSGLPTGTLDPGTELAILNFVTDESATCRYGTASDVIYVLISNRFATTGGASHSVALTGIQDGVTYTYYSRCQDSAGNSNMDDFVISFSVASSSL